MSEPGTPSVTNIERPAAPVPPKRRVWMRRALWTVGTVLLLLVLLVVGCLWYSTTDGFQQHAKKILVSTLEDATGGKVDVGAARLNLAHLAVEVDGLVIHGLEGPGEAPYLSADRILLRLTLKSLFARTSSTGAMKYVTLSLLHVDAPHVHLIVNKDGTTNQPVPKKKSTSTEPVLDTLLDLQANTVELADGLVVFNDKAIPFDLAANDLGVNVHYLSSSDRYGVSVGLRDLRTKMMAQPEAQSKLQLEAEIGRKIIALKSLNLETGKTSHLEINGLIEEFDHPVWHASVKGSVEIPQISVLSGFPGLQGGSVDLDVSGHSCAVEPQVAQKQPHFWQRRHPKQSPASTKVLPPDPDCEKGYLLAGAAKWHDAGYVDQYVRVRGVNGGATLAITPTELLLKALTANLPGGGSLAGELRINNWLGEVAEDAAVKSPTVAAGQKTVNAAATAVNAKPPVEGSRTLPAVNRAHAYLTVTLSRISLRTVLAITQPKGYKDLGLDTAASGPVKVEWGGPATDIASSVIVDTNLTLAPTGVHTSGVMQNIPLAGSVKAVYRGDREVVNITSLHAQTPATVIDGTGVLGVNKGDPLTRLQLDASFHDLSEFDSVLNYVGYQSNGKTGSAALPVALHGNANFHGVASGPLKNLEIRGHAEASELQAHLGSAGDVLIDTIVADADYSPAGLSVANSTIHRGSAVLQVSGSAKPHRVVTKRAVNYAWDNDAQIDAKVLLADAKASDVLEIAGQGKLPITGTVAANIRATGTIGNIQGDGQVSLRDGVAYDQPFHSIVAQLTAHGQEIAASRLDVDAQGVKVTGNGAYNMTSKHLRAHLQGNDVRLSNLQAMQKANSPVDGVLSFNADADGTVEQPGLKANLRLAQVTLKGQPLGEAAAELHSEADVVYLTSHSTLVSAPLDLTGHVTLTGDYPMQADAKFSNLDVKPVLAILGQSGIGATSLIAGEAHVSGPAKKPAMLSGNAAITQFRVGVKNIELKTESPIRASLANGVARLDELHILGTDTDLRASGTVQVFSADGTPLPKQGGRLDMKSSGNVNLALVHVVDPQVISSGAMSFDVSAGGSTGKPALAGTVKFADGNLALADIPNGLSKINGTMVFTEDRLQVQNFTAMSGGGKISLGGFLQYRNGLYADMTAKADAVRVRYYGVSATMNADIRLQGTGDGASLGGNVLITRFGLAETFDFASVSGGSSDVQAPPDPDSLLNKIRLSVKVKSAPQLDFQNSYAKIAGTVDLTLGGTLAVPSVLGKVTITDGSATFAGTQYQLQRGQVFFNNPVRIDPTIDLDASARVENYDVTIGVHGTSKNFKLSYRSEPPLSQADIFNLLALGRTQEEAQINTQQLQQQGQDPTTNALLGGALNATVSNRVNKLFGGAGKVKIDPAFVGTLGTSSARITVEQQLSRQITVVFATNVNSQAQQLIQLQYQLSPNKSIVATRDENGVFSIVYKIRKRYR